MSDSAPRDTLETFAYALRELRMAEGNPTLAALSAKTGISKSVISDAFAGKRPPTENTIALLIDALGGDRSAWLARRTRLVEKPSDPVEVSPAPSARRSISMGGAIVLSATSLAVGALVASLVWSGLLGGTGGAAEAATPTPTPTAPSLPASPAAAADGVDPMTTACRHDAVIAASEERGNGDFQVQMMYSNDCMGVWGRITRYDEKSSGGELMMRIYPQADPESSRSQERTGADLQSLYTPLLIEPDVEARVCGVAYATINGELEQLGEPLCI